MEQKIDWQLFSDGKMIISQKDVIAKYTYKTKLSYGDNGIYNEYDYKKNLFIHKTDEINMEINFNNKTCRFNFEKEGNCIFDIKCNIKISEESIELEYSIDDTLKKLIINIKDIKL